MLPWSDNANLWKILWERHNLCRPLPESSQSSRNRDPTCVKIADGVNPGWENRIWAVRNTACNSVKIYVQQKGNIKISEGQVINSPDWKALDRTEFVTDMTVCSVLELRLWPQRRNIPTPSLAGQRAHTNTGQALRLRQRARWTWCQVTYTHIYGMPLVLSFRNYRYPQMFRTPLIPFFIWYRYRKN